MTTEFLIMWIVVGILSMLCLVVWQVEENPNFLNFLGRTIQVFKWFIVLTIGIILILVLFAIVKWAWYTLFVWKM